MSARSYRTETGSQSRIYMYKKLEKVRKAQKERETPQQPVERLSETRSLEYLLHALLMSPCTVNLTVQACGSGCLFTETIGTLLCMRQPRLKVEYAKRICNFLHLLLTWIAGFDHSAFTFSYEAYLAQAHISPTEIPPGALVTFLQKGLQFLEIEANLNDVSETRNSKLLTTFVH